MFATAEARRRPPPNSDATRVARRRWGSPPWPPLPPAPARLLGLGARKSPHGAARARGPRREAPGGRMRPGAKMAAEGRIIRRHEHCAGRRRPRLPPVIIRRRERCAGRRRRRLRNTGRRRHSRPPDIQRREHCAGRRRRPWNIRGHKHCAGRRRRRRRRQRITRRHEYCPGRRRRRLQTICTLFFPGAPQIGCRGRGAVVAPRSSPSCETLAGGTAHRTRR